MISQRNPHFLLIRFAPGSAGRFLATMLMGSDSIAHFDPKVLTLADKIDYIKCSFTKDLASWLKTEPNDKEAWNINFVSNKYPRGQDLTVEQFTELSQQHCTSHYHRSVAEGKIIIIPWNKLNIPSFYEGDLVSIFLDQKSRRWFHRSLWYKHYGKKDGYIHLKENDPACHRQHQIGLVSKFNNPVIFKDDCRNFARTMIMDSQFVRQFSDMQSLMMVKNHNVIELSNLLEETRFLAVIKTLVRDLGLKDIDEWYLKEGFAHWKSCHGY